MSKLRSREVKLLVEVTPLQQSEGLNLSLHNTFSTIPPLGNMAVLAPHTSHLHSPGQVSRFFLAEFPFHHLQMTKV